MNRNDFIKKKEISTPKIDEKVLGPMIMAELAKHGISIDDTVENRELIAKFIAKIVAEGLNPVIKKQEESAEEGLRRLRELLGNPGTSPAGPQPGPRPPDVDPYNPNHGPWTSPNPWTIPNQGLPYVGDLPQWDDRTTLPGGAPRWTMGPMEINATDNSTYTASNSIGATTASLGPLVTPADLATSDAEDDWLAEE